MAMQVRMLRRSLHLKAPLPMSDVPSRPSPQLGIRLVRSVFANWAGEAVFVVSGFILPRLISTGMSQEQLGIWDFGWSMRSYVLLAGGAFGSGAGHYVARYRASQQWPE